MKDPTIENLNKALKQLNGDDIKSCRQTILESLWHLHNNRSVTEHRMFFAWLRFLFDNTADCDKYNQNQFTQWADDELKHKIGHVISKRTKATINGEEVIFVKEKVLSLKFAELGQKEFHTLFEASKEYYKVSNGIIFDDWYNSYWKTDGMCESVTCQNMASEIHHIFFGNGVREICDKNGWTIKLCKKCHDKSHGKTDGTIPDSKLDTIQKLMAVNHCKVKKLDYMKCLKEIKGK